MKIGQIIISIFLILIICCNSKKEPINYFTKSSDTLVLITEKIKGRGMIPEYPGIIDMLDTIESYDFQVEIPENITNVKLACQIVDFKPFWYNNIKENKSDYITTFLKDYYPDKFDTLNIPSLKNNSICLLIGQIGKDTVLIIDENNNKDFRDDSIRGYRKLDFKSTTQLIKCKYNIYNGERLIEDSGLVSVGRDEQNELLFSVSHHIGVKFSIDDQNYQIEVKNGLPFVRFCFEDPILALVSQGRTKKDSLPKSEMISKGEYLKLDDRYYRFDDITNDGRYITLTKEKNFENKIGTQVGMIAPDFNCQTIENDTISLNDCKGGYLLLVNITSCWSEISSYEYYKRLTKKYESKIEILGIDNSPNFLKQTIMDLNLTGKFIIAKENQSIQNNYRKNFSSRMCFLISPEGRIADKFEISNWKLALSRQFN